MLKTYNYSMPVKIFFWLFWLVGAFAAFLFFIFTISSGNGDPYFPKGWGIVAWDLLILLSIIFLLIKTAWHFFKADREGSNLMLWIAFAAFGLPLLGFGGCLLPEMFR